VGYHPVRLVLHGAAVSGRTLALNTKTQKAQSSSTNSKDAALLGDSVIGPNRTR
jgi:hypothetical protein